ncbi:hypothetical protein, partial [Chryseobacterium rhizosphaerae]|uniref:hypothetical protein n=1 Tax=Chryseobacterium rhizosphaerae TaxID=395937 RepID=UPI001E3B5B0D
FAPLKNERYSVSAEELLAKQKRYTLKDNNSKKRDQNFLKIKVAKVKKICIFAVPIWERRSRWIEGLEKGLRLQNKL